MSHVNKCVNTPLLSSELWEHSEGKGLQSDIIYWNSETSETLQSSSSFHK